MSTIGENIRNRRIELEMTQEELAHKMGYKSKSTINKIELGINDIPQSKIVQFAHVLNTTPKALMGWEDVEKNNNTIKGIIVRMRNDKDFLEVVEALYNLDDAKLAGVQQMLKAFV